MRSVTYTALHAQVRTRHRTLRTTHCTSLPTHTPVPIQSCVCLICVPHDLICICTYRLPHNTGASVTLETAVPLLYTFCARLPGDRYCTSNRLQVTLEEDLFDSTEPRRYAFDLEASCDVNDNSGKCEEGYDEGEGRGDGAEEWEKAGGEDEKEGEGEALVRIPRGLYRCHLRLPNSAPASVLTVTGPWHWSKRSAKQSACLEACRMLHHVGALDDRLVPLRGRALEGDLGIFDDLDDDESRNEDGDEHEDRNQAFRSIKRLRVCGQASRTHLFAPIEWDTVSQGMHARIYSVQHDMKNGNGSEFFALISLVDLSVAMLSGSPFYLPFSNNYIECQMKMDFLQSLYLSLEDLKCLQISFGLIMSSILSAKYFPVYMVPSECLSPLLVAPLLNVDGALSLDWQTVRTLNQEISCPQKTIQTVFSSEGFDGLKSLVRTHLTH